MITTEIPLDAFRQAHEHVKQHAHHTPLIGSRSLSEATGFDVALKAESFQNKGSDKIRGPQNKFTHHPAAEKQAGPVSGRSLVGERGFEPPAPASRRRASSAHAAEILDTRRA